MSNTDANPPKKPAARPSLVSVEAPAPQKQSPISTTTPARKLRRGPDDLLHLVVEIKGYRREDAKEKKTTMDTYWVPAVNNLRTLGRWAFAELTEIYQIDADFKAKVASEFDAMVARAGGVSPEVSA